MQVGIIYKHRFEPAKAEAEKLQDWLEKEGISAFVEEMGIGTVITENGGFLIERIPFQQVLLWP